jgi:hypothetical protein
LAPLVDRPISLTRLGDDFAHQPPDLLVMTSYCCRNRPASAVSIAIVDHDSSGWTPTSMLLVSKAAASIGRIR